MGWRGIALAVAIAAAITALLVAVALLVVWLAQAKAVLDCASRERSDGVRPPGVPDTVLVAPKETHDRLYALVGRFWDEVLTPAGCADTAWLTSGSLLGWARHDGAIIPWDDDVDLACRREDADRIVAQAKRAGWGVRRPLCFYKFAPPELARTASWLDLRLGMGGDELDLFPMERDAAGVWQNPCAVFSRERYADSDLWPLQRVRFGPVDARVPRRPEPFLASAYGADWKTRACGGVSAYHARHAAMGPVPPWLWSVVALSNPLLRDICFPLAAT